MINENIHTTSGADEAPQPDQNYITSSGDRKYFTILPNIVDDSNLSPGAVRLYVHFKRVAGEDGACWQSRETLSERCSMSSGSITAAKSELAERGFITIENRRNPKGGYPYHHITVTDIWRENVLRYSEKEARSYSDLARSDFDLARSECDTNKNPLKDNSLNNNRPVVVFSETLQEGYGALDINLEQQPFQGYSEEVLTSFLAWLQQQRITGLKAENVAKKLLPTWEVNPTDKTQSEEFITAEEFLLQRI